MIKLFRNFRRNLLSEKKFKHYFKYAIGEIILVIIGILIALSINNWNTKRNSIEQQKKLISQVILDLKQSEDDIKEMIKFCDQRALASSHVTQSFWTKEPLSDSLIRSFAIPLSNRRYRPNLSMMNSLITSGDIQLIQSVKVRSQINASFEYIHTQVEDILRYEEQYYRPGIDLVRTHMDVISFNMQHLKEERMKTVPNFAYSTYPQTFTDIPFPIQLEDIYQNQHIYNGYGNLLIAFRNSRHRYEELLTEVQHLLRTLEEEGYK